MKRTFGVIVEGTYDESALIPLIKRTAGEEVNVICRPCGGKSKLMRFIPTYLQEFCQVVRGNPVDKALIVRDSDRKNAEELKRDLRKRIPQNITFPFPIKLILSVNELEAWLLADETALVKVANGRRVKATRGPEELHDPKMKLEQILDEHGVSYSAGVAGRIAQAADIQKLLSKCPSFKCFHRAVQDC